MPDQSHLCVQSDAADEDPHDRFVPRAAQLIAALILFAIPLRIVRQGFLPLLDDTPADAAKAISGRDWTDILILRDEFRLDPHIGWHALLQVVSHVMRWGVIDVVMVSVITLFVVLTWAPLLWMKRPESWLAALVAAVGLGTGLAERYMLGRPFLISGAVLLTILWLWQRYGSIGPTRKSVALMTLCLTVAVVLHGSWYLWILLIASFMLAREYSWGKALALAWMLATVIGAALTLHPVDYLVESVRMGRDGIGLHMYQSTLVHEFRPLSENVAGLFLLGFIVILRFYNGTSSDNRPSLFRSPAFWLACIGFVLGYKASRFWTDWGLLSALVVCAAEVEVLLLARVSKTSYERLALALGLSASLYLMITNDADSRWTMLRRETRFLRQSDPQTAEWMPSSGGILYSAEMALFYQTFSANPDAQFRYITGFEPAMMPTADFMTYQSIGLSHGNPLAYMPWVLKMRPADRIALHWPEQPQIPQLEWKNISGVWLGRIPRSAE